MAFPKKLPALSVIVLVSMALTGCEDFISAKEHPAKQVVTETPRAPGPAATYEAPAVEDISEETADTEFVRMEAVRTINKLGDLRHSAGYRKFNADFKDIPPLKDKASIEKSRVALEKNRPFLNDVYEVFTISDEGFERMIPDDGTETKQEREVVREIMILHRFSLIMKQLEHKTGKLDISGGAITSERGGYFFKSNPNVPPKAIVVLKDDSGNNTFIRGFEGMRLENGGTRINLDGQV